MTYGTKADINAFGSVLTYQITEGQITPCTAFNRFWGYMFHARSNQELTNEEYNQIVLNYLSEIMNRFLPRLDTDAILEAVKTTDPLHRYNVLINLVFGETPVKYNTEDQEEGGSDTE